MVLSEQFRNKNTDLNENVVQLNELLLLNFLNTCLQIIPQLFLQIYAVIIFYNRIWMLCKFTKFKFLAGFKVV